MSDKRIDRAKQILSANKYMILATSQEEKPWSTPVFFAYDKNYNFYWYSRKDTRHSLNIKANNNVSVSIFGVGNVNEGFGVYVEGVAYEVTVNELTEAMEIYASKGANNDEERKELTTEEDFIGNAPIRMYKLIPAKIYVSNESTKWHGKWIDSKIEIKL